MERQNKTYNYGYLGREREIRKEARRFYTGFISGLIALGLYAGCQIYDGKKQDTRTIQNTNDITRVFK